MARFSTHGSDLMKQLKLELSIPPLKDGEQAVFTFVEIGQLLSHAYAVTYINGADKMLRLKVWQAASDTKRFKLGIYSLDSLALSESDIPLDKVQLSKIDALLAENLGTVDFDGIVLDGLHCKMYLGDKSFDWNINNSMNRPLSDLVTILREKTSDQIDRLF